MESVLEILPAGRQGRWKRKWPDEVKARIVAEMFMSGITIIEFARRLDVSANHVSLWRTPVGTGPLVLIALEEFAELMCSAP